MNISTDADNKYFSDGITEEIINALTKNNGLKVIARTSSFAFKGRNDDVREIAGEALELLKNTLHRNAEIINFRQDPSLEKLREMDEFYQLHISNLTFQEETETHAINSAEAKTSSAELDIRMKTLLDFIKTEKSYLDAQLSLGNLAENLQLHPNKLSYLINAKTGMNFNEFINQFRLRYFKEIAANPANSHLTILGMAYESGFNSKTVFNSYFKKTEGITPGNWLRQVKK